VHWTKTNAAKNNEGGVGTKGKVTKETFLKRAKQRGVSNG